ncbi:SWI/SNF-related matrix-associated actin-dependent regulator of chromatin subfamily A-like protein 1 isoform X2 [Rhodnius prolixus]|uniref:SWI/SNF-related matrix-associated actin-dependent regulator of chromatin subfamily A-like protein 1 isoform X2 n=1 Tax=Rhodnius prolixus TaxID=13249 RepID=UPI003D189F92
MASSLTPEQKKRIEENRRLALERRNEKLKQQISASSAHGVAASGVVSNQEKNVSSAHKSSLFSIKRPPYHRRTSKPPISSFHKPNNSSASENLSNNVSTLPQKPNFQVNEKTWNVIVEPMTGTCSLISRDRFVVQIGYNKELLDLFKTIPGKEYDPKKKVWSFPLEQYNKFKEVTAPLSPNVIIGNLPKAVLQNFMDQKQKPQDYRNMDISKIESTLLNSLFPFQKEGVQFGVSKGGRCLIADDMGLGKTLQALGIADYYINDWPLLIVCPSSMRYQWEEEILRYLPKIPSYSIYVQEHRKDYVEKNVKVLIISYDLMGKLKEFITSFGFGVIILDESHCLKNIKTIRTKAALEIVKKCKRCILLSGTPALSRPAELFCQIKAVNPLLFKDMIEFGVRYCEGKHDKFGWNFNGSSHLEELKIILDEMVMIRRLKCNVLEQLPAKIRQVITLSPELIDSKNKTLKAFEKKLVEVGVKGTERRSTLLAYFSETGRVKIRAICEHVEQLLEQGRKFLLFAHHREVLDAVCDLLENSKTYYIRIDGSVSSEDRKSVCDQFQEEEKFRVAVLSITAANTGVTLTAAQLVVFAELFWNPGGKSQTTIMSFFSQMDDDVDDNDLANLMDELEGVPEKKKKYM